MAHHLERREQVFPRIGNAARRDRADRGVDREDHVGASAQVFEREGIDGGAVDQDAPIKLDRPHQSRHSH